MVKSPFVVSHVTCCPWTPLCCMLIASTTNISVDSPRIRHTVTARTGAVTFEHELNRERGAMMLVCPQTGFARRPRGEEACTNAHKRREEPYFRRGARASCLPRGSKGHKRAGSSVGKFEHRTGAGAQERGGRPALSGAAACVHGRQPRVCSGAHQSGRCRRESARRPPQRAARRQARPRAARSRRGRRARPGERGHTHARRLRSARSTPAFPDPMRWQATSWQRGPAAVIAKAPFRGSHGPARAGRRSSRVGEPRTGRAGAA